MVFSGQRQRGRSGGRGGEKRCLKTPLHNFALPSLRHLRRIKLPDRGRWSPPPPAKRPDPGLVPDCPGIEAVGEKLVLDLKSAADKMKDVIFRGEADSGLGCSYSEEEEEKGEVGRWNLRTRRGFGVSNSPPVPAAVAGVATRPGGGEGSKFSPGKQGETGGEEKKRENLVVELTRKEMEDDLLVMLGRRAILRPKKRPKNVQLQLDMLFPGLWLTKINLDSYKVAECSDNAK